MTVTGDEEAFLRAVALAPADDAPRLVYADWLDDRGDPRAAYLRLTTAAAGRVRGGLPWDDLKHRLRALRDPGALEREARRLGMVRQGERSYVIENLP